MTSPLPICSLQNPDHPRVEGAPNSCHLCSVSLCLRKQVVNLALGLTEQMLCLDCLARKNGNSPAEILDGIKDYVLGRECFAKEWKRYSSVESCPDRAGCVPGKCFE